MSENIGWKTLLRLVLIQQWDKWPKCFSDQNVSTKMTEMSQRKKTGYLQYIKIWNTYYFLFLSNNKLKLAYADNIGQVQANQMWSTSS